MADRRVTVWNPAGYQEVLHTTDRLFVDSASQFAQTDFTQNITAITADFSEQITLGLNPTASDHAVTLGYLNGIADGLTLTGEAPIEINNQIISILAATDTAAGAVRFATDAEVINGTAVDAAVKPDQIELVTNSIQRRLESSGETEIPSKVVGELVMDALKELDRVAYLRFASVYKDFQETDDFRKFIDNNIFKTPNTDGKFISPSLNTLETQKQILYEYGKYFIEEEEYKTFENQDKFYDYIKIDEVLKKKIIKMK